MAKWEVDAPSKPADVTSAHRYAIADLHVRVAALEADKRFIIAERDSTFALMLARAEAAEAEAHACGAEREAWKDRAEAADARVAELTANLKTATGALGDIADGEPEWPDDDKKELMWCRDRAIAAIARVKEGDA